MCKPYTILVADRSHCIPIDSCPYCAKNEMAVNLVPKCPLTCDNLMTAPICSDFEQRPGCICSAGFVRNKAGKCVMFDDCDGESSSMLQMFVGDKFSSSFL